MTEAAGAPAHIVDRRESKPLGALDSTEVSSWLKEILCRQLTADPFYFSWADIVSELSTIAEFVPPLGMSCSAQPVSLEVEAVIRRIREAGVLTPSPIEIRKYLSENINTTKLVETLCFAAIERFGARAQVSLELFQSREYDDEYLTINIRQERYEPELMREIEEVNSVFDDELSSVSGWVQITTDFHPPR
jgi:hypothetical protein